MELLEKLNIPLINPQRIPVKMLVQQLQPTSEDKRILESHIASMKLVSLLNDQTIHIRPYKDDEYSYQAIYVFNIELKKDDRIISLAQIIHSAFPEPTILLLNTKTTNYISLASKRINKIEQGKTVVEDVSITDISSNALDNHLTLDTMHGSNLKEYYSNMIKWLYKLKVLSITKIYPTKDLDYKTILKQYEMLNSEISRLKEEYKKATMKSEKMRIDDDLYDKEIDLKQLIKQLKKE